MDRILPTPTGLDRVNKDCTDIGYLGVEGEFNLAHGCRIVLMAIKEVLHTTLPKLADASNNKSDDKNHNTSNVLLLRLAGICLLALFRT